MKTKNHMSKDSYVLITGGAGYIGSHINKLLNELGYQTIVFDNLVNGHKDMVKWGQFIKGDLSNSDQLHELFGTYAIKVVMHLAAFAYVHESILNPRKYYTNNVVGTVNLLEAMVDCSIPYLVFSSSCATYGILNQVPVTEEHPQCPINPYGHSKLVMEQIINEYGRAHGIKACVLRYFNAAGADPAGTIGERHIPETHLIPLILAAASRTGPSVQIYGNDYPTTDGTCIRDYIHVADIAQAHLLAMDYLLSGGDVFAFNLSNEHGYSILQVLDAIKRGTGLSIKSEILPRRQGDPPILVGESEKARRVLGWRPQYQNLEIIIDTAWRWHQKETAIKK